MTLKFEQQDDEAATCPKCGNSWGDLWDYGWHANDESEINCPSCGIKLTLRRNITVDYDLAEGWVCDRCNGTGKSYFFPEKCKNSQCDHGLGDRPMSCPVKTDICEHCKGKAVFYD